METYPFPPSQQRQSWRFDWTTAVLVLIALVWSVSAINAAKQKDRVEEIAVFARTAARKTHVALQAKLDRMEVQLDRIARKVGAAPKASPPPAPEAETEGAQ